MNTQRIDGPGVEIEQELPSQRRWIVNRVPTPQEVAEALRGWRDYAESTARDTFAGGDWANNSTIDDQTKQADCDGVKVENP